MTGMFTLADGTQVPSFDPKRVQFARFLAAARKANLSAADDYSPRVEVVRFGENDRYEAVLFASVLGGVYVMVQDSTIVDRFGLAETIAQFQVYPEAA